MEESAVRAHSQAQVKMQPVRDQVMRHSTFFFFYWTFHFTVCVWGGDITTPSNAKRKPTTFSFYYYPSPTPHLPPTMKYVAHTLFPSQLLRSRWSEFSCEISPAAQSSSSNLKLLINNLSQAVANLKKKQNNNNTVFHIRSIFLLQVGEKKASVFTAVSLGAGNNLDKTV